MRAWYVTLRGVLRSRY